MILRFAPSRPSFLRDLRVNPFCFIFPVNGGLRGGLEKRVSREGAKERAKAAKEVDPRSGFGLRAATIG